MVLESKGEVVEDTAQEVDAHEEQRYTDDLLILVYLVVLGPERVWSGCCSNRDCEELLQERARD